MDYNCLLNPYARTGVGSVYQSERAKLRFQSLYSFSLFFRLNNMKDWCVLKNLCIFIDLLTLSVALRILDVFEFLVSLEMTLYANICYFPLISSNLLSGV